MNPFTWDSSVGQYRYPNGRFVPRSVVRAALDSAYRKEQRKIQALSLQLKNGEISLMTWRQSMREAIQSIHLYSAAIAKGGWAQLTQSDFGRVGAAVKSEYKFLEKLSRGLSNQSIPMDGSFFDRARMYGEAGRETFYQIQRSVMKAAGFRFEANVLNPAEHCQGANSCVEQTDRGRVPIGKLIRIGQRRCLRNCVCDLIYFYTLTDD